MPRKPTTPRTRGTSSEPPDAPERDGRDWTIPAGGFDSFRAAAVHLRRPFTPEAIRFKVQSVFKHGSGPDKGKPNGCLIVSYIDARLVIERLNLLVPGLWSPSYREAGKFMWCDLTVDGVTRADVGESAKGMSKDLVSDALKRAAVHFGVGVSVYALPQIRLFLPKDARHIEVRGFGEKQTIMLKDQGHDSLRGGYRKWLAEHGERLFGPDLDHGDVEGAIDVPEEPVVEAGQDADPEAEKLRDLARRGYDAICKVTPGGAAIEFFPAAFNEALVQAGTDVVRLEALIVALDGKLAEARAKVAA